jgi:ADP-ribose pyrophosphatase YjhB (NUDIX family)
MWVDDDVLASVRRRFGVPRRLELVQEIGVEERELVLASGRAGRSHDVTFFVFNRGRLALIRKPHFAPGVWRPPGGGVHRGEEFQAGAAREAREELGVRITLERYLVHTSAVFTCAGEEIRWQTHVLSASTDDPELVPLDTIEIAAARWGTVAELAGPIRERLLATGRGLWRYRVALHDAALAALGPTDSRR